MTRVPRPGQHAVTAMDRIAVGDHLASLGMRVLDRDCRGAGDVIDVIAEDGVTLVACVIRPPGSDLTLAESRRLRRLAVRWVLRHGLIGLIFDALRVDVVSVTAGPDGREFTRTPAAG